MRMSAVWRTGGTFLTLLFGAGCGVLLTLTVYGAHRKLAQRPGESHAC